jgi:hypothetical protein
VAPGIRGRVRIFGVAFEDAIAKAHSEGYLKSKFQLVDPGVVKNDGPPATLILLTRFDRARSTLIVQAYQCVDTTPETFLIHAELTDGSHHFHHLDGSQLYLSPEQRSNLSISCTKEKGKKVKYFRIDDDVSRADAYDLIRRFFPIESLTLECFSVSGERE